MTILVHMRRFTLLLCVLALACAAPAAAVIGGATDTSNRYSYVGIATNGQTVCSGALVSATVFVTAAHCFAGGPSVGAPRAGHQVIAVGFDVVPTKLTLRGVLTVDPAFCLECGPGGSPENDLAVVVLDTRQDGLFATLPKLGDADALGKKSSTTLVGYSEGIAKGGGKPAPVTSYERSYLTVGLGNAGSSVSDSFLKLDSAASTGGGACFGDSGGPNLLPGTDTILAITSYGKNDVCKGPSYSYRLDTAHALGFLAGFLG
jgi:Trypsin